MHFWEIKTLSTSARQSCLFFTQKPLWKKRGKEKKKKELFTVIHVETIYWSTATTYETQEGEIWLLNTIRNQHLKIAFHT